MPRAYSLRHAGALAIVIAAAGFSAPARAQQDFMRNIGAVIGIVAPEQDDIEYRERAPLVVPPDTKLRQPQPAIQQRVARWPVNPEINEKKKKTAESNKPVERSAWYGDEGTNPALSPNEMRSYGRLGSDGRVSNEPVGQNEQIRDTWIDPRILAAMRLKDDTTVLRPGVEPTRRSLTDPPAGLRLPAGNAPIRATAEPRGPNLLDDGVNGVRDYQRQSAQP